MKQDESKSFFNGIFCSFYLLHLRQSYFEYKRQTNDFVNFIKYVSFVIIINRYFFYACL